MTWRGVGVVAAVLAVVALMVGGLLRTEVETGIKSFLPSDDPAVTDLQRVASAFGGDPIVVLLESAEPRSLLGGDQIEQVVRLEGELSVLPDVAAVYGPGTLLNQIAAQTQALLAELFGRRDSQANLAAAKVREAGGSEAEAQAAKQASLQQFNIRYGPLMVQGLPAGLPTLQNAGFIDAVVFEDSAPRPQWQFVVPSERSIAILVRPREGADAGAINGLVDAVRRTVAAAELETSRVTISGVPTVAAALSAEATREGPLLGGIALVAVGACFLLVPWTRRSRRLVPLATTLLAIGLTLSIFGYLGRPLSIGAVAFLSVVLGIGCYYPTYFAVRARPRTVLTVACATAASFSTLLLSPLPLVRDLGLTLSIGVLLSALLGLLARRWVAAPAESAQARTEQDAPEARDRLAPLSVMLRRRKVVSAFLVAVIVAGAGWAVLPNLKIQTNIEQLASGLPALDDAQHVEGVIGSSGEIDVVLRGENVLAPEAVAWMNKAEELIITRYGDQMRRVISPPMLLSFLGEKPDSSEIEAAARLLPDYLMLAVVERDRETAIMSFGVDFDDLAGTRQLRDELLAALPPAPPGFTAELAGLPLVAVRGQELVSQDRLQSNALGILAAGLVLAIGLRRRLDAVRAVVAATLATGVGLFLLWITGTALSPITVALGSLTAAVGCEFTVLLSEASRRRNRSLSRAVLLVTATSVIGYLVLLISGIPVVREFGLLLGGAVVLALLASVCVVRLTAGTDSSASEDDSETTSRQATLAGV